jgi:hypothetical protein
MAEPQLAYGALIESGASDWQLFQQDQDGHANIALTGRWAHDQPGVVECRLVCQDTGTAVGTGLDWHRADVTHPDRTWKTVIRRVPAGGLYRLETRLRTEANGAGEWSPRGDMRHCLGVGDLWAIAGQSNSAGYGRGPYNDAPEPGIHMLRHNESWALATHPLSDATDTRHPVNRENANPGHSPYLQFARILKRTLGYPVGLIPTALGGSPLSRWNPTEPGDSQLFDNMRRAVALAGGRVRGICWYQGESDTGSIEQAQSYADRFVAAVGAWRETLGDPRLPVLTVQLNRVILPADEKGDRCWSIVRDCQRLVPRRLPGTAVVPSTDLSVCDGIHIGSDGNLLLGERLARAALGMVHGRAIAWQAPDLQSAKRTGDGSIVELAFAPVTSRVGSVDGNAIPFRVEDNAGVVAVRRVVYPGDHTVKLELQRPVGDGAVVHGGYGFNPVTMPMDYERLMPVLAFANVAVT